MMYNDFSMHDHTPLIVITGGTGYLGSVLTPLLVANSYRVRVISRHNDHTLIESMKADVRSYPKKILRGAYAVIDLAAIASDKECELHPRLTQEINVTSRIRTAKLAKTMGVKKYILASSCSVYGRQTGLLTEKSKPAPVTVYAKSNLEAEKGTLALDDDNFSVTVFRLGSLFGISPQIRFDILFNTMVRALFQTGTISVVDGTQWRPILHVYDAAEAFLLAIQSPTRKVHGQIFNVVSSSQNIQIFPLAERVFRALKRTPRITVNSQIRDHRSYKVSGNKIRDILHFTAHKTPEEAARRIYQALAETKPGVRMKPSRCLICGGTEMNQFLSLGSQVPANTYGKASLQQQQQYPLAVTYCQTCHHSQLTSIVSPKMLFTHYAYFSSTSPQLIPYFKAYAHDLLKKFPKQAKYVLDIGSNDGTLLQNLQLRGSTILGVDPAKNIAAIARVKGIPTINKFFTLALARQIKKEHGSMSMVIANHVLAHTGNPHDMVAGIAHVLSRDGVFVCEVKYLADLIEKNEFDTIYHEHISYFLLKSLITLLRMHGLSVFDVRHVSREGGSLRIFASHTPLRFPTKPSVRTYLTKEQHRGLYALSTYEDFAKKPIHTKQKLIAMIRALKKSGKRIAGYGASAKGGTLLQYCGIDEQQLEFIVDESSSKTGNVMPGNRIPIVSPSVLKEHTPDYILILAWNYADSIMRKERWFTARGGKFIIPIPSPRLVRTVDQA